jgi:hypothetical protein
MHETFLRQVHLIGLMTLFVGFIANFIPVVYLALAYGIMPQFGELLGIWATVAAAYGFNWIIQPPSFFPVLGVVGTYVSFLSGSLADVRMPVITSALKVTDTTAGTREGDVIAAIAVTTSVFVTFSLFTLFVIIGKQIIEFFPPFVIDAFSYIVPAIFSAVFVNMAISNLKLSLPILFICVAVTIGVPMLGISNVFTNIIGIFLGICLAKVLFTRTLL